MPWIESHSVIGRHRKFKGLARQLKISLPQAIGHMHLLWHTAIEQAEDGDLSTWTPGSIAESASWEGSEQEFLKAVQDNQLMDGQKIHDWLDYAGKYLTSKYKTSHPEKLTEIWGKFGKIYGKEVKRNSLVLPEGSPPNITKPYHTENTGVDVEERKEEKLDELKAAFQAALKAYPSGKKRGLEPEWKHFKKLHGKRAAEIVPLLLPAVLGYSAHLAREKTQSQHIKHFQGWITEERWTQEYAAPTQVKLSAEDERREWIKKNVF